MFEKNMRLAWLLDFYGEALDERTQTIMKAYYEDDLSLAEIADDVSISRQGVRHIIKKGEEQLEFFEKNLMLASHYDELSLATKSIQEVINTLQQEDANKFEKEITSLSNIISTILNKGF